MLFATLSLAGMTIAGSVDLTAFEASPIIHPFFSTEKNGRCLAADSPPGICYPFTHGFFSHFLPGRKTGIKFLYYQVALIFDISMFYHVSDKVNQPLISLLFFSQQPHKLHCCQMANGNFMMTQTVFSYG